MEQYGNKNFNNNKNIKVLGVKNKKVTISTRRGKPIIRNI